MTKVTVYVTSETLERMKTEAGARSLGALLDEMFDQTLSASFDLNTVLEAPEPTEWMPPKSAKVAKATPAQVVKPPATRKPTFPHQWKDSATFGKVCSACHVPKNSPQAAEPCQGDLG